MIQVSLFGYRGDEDIFGMAGLFLLLCGLIYISRCFLVISEVYVLDITL